VDGLPEGAESTADVLPDKVDLLKTAFDGLAAPFADFLAAASVAGGRRGGKQHAVSQNLLIMMVHMYLSLS
jgi:hypothetical protein